MNVCDVNPCLFVMRDSVGGRALPCPQQRHSEGSWRLEHVLSCASKWGWLCVAHNEVGIGGPVHRVGGVGRVVCVQSRGGPEDCVGWEDVQCSVSVNCVEVCSANFQIKRNYFVSQTSKLT